MQWQAGRCHAKYVDVVLKKKNAMVGQNYTKKHKMQ